MFKKLLSIVAAATLVVSASAASAGVDAVALYDAAGEETTVVPDEDTLKVIEQDQEAIDQINEGLEGLTDLTVTWPGYLVLKAKEIDGIKAMVAKWEANIEDAYKTGKYQEIPASELTSTNEELMALVANFEPEYNEGMAQIQEDKDDLAEIQSNYKELIAETEEDYPGILVLKKNDVAAVDDAIATVENEIADGYNDFIIDGVYPGVKQADLVAAREALMSLSGEIEGAYNAILEAAAEDDAQIEEISESLNTLLEEAAEDFKAFLSVKADDIKAAQAAVAALNKAYNAAIETALAETGVYEGVPQADIVAATEAVMSLSAEYTAAYDAVLDASLVDKEAIKKISEDLAALEKTIESDFVGFKALKGDDIKAAQATIDALNKAYTAALETALKETGVYVSIPKADLIAAAKQVATLSSDFEEAYNAVLEDSLVDDEAIADAESALAELKETAEKEFAGFLTLKAADIKAVDEAIAALNKAYTDALEEALTKTGMYVGPQADIVAVTEQIMSLAGEMDGAYEAILEAAAEDDAQIEEVADTLTALLEEAAEDFKAFLTVKADDIKAAQAAVDALNKAYNAAIETALAETGVYDGIPQADVVAANEAVMSLSAEYTAAYDAVLEEAAADDETIQEIQDSLAQFIEETEESFPGYLVAKKDEIAAIEAEIDALNKAFNAAQEKALAETGVYVGPQGEIVAVTEAIMALAAGVDASVAAIEDEYNADVESMNELAVAMQELNATIAEEFPGYATLKAEEITKINKGIEKINDEINAGMEAAFETGVYNGPAQAEIVEITEAIMSLSAEMEITYDGILEAADYDYEYIEALDEYMAYLDEWFAENFPGYPTVKTAEVEKINAGLAELNKQYEDARYEALNETGVYAGIDYTLLNEVYAEILDYADGSDALMEQADELLAEDYAQWEELWDAVEGLKEDALFPAFAELKAAEFEAADDALDALYAAMENGVEKFYETTVYAGPTQAEFAAATEQVMALITEQAEMLAAIQNPYNEDVETLNAYMDKVKDVLDGDEYSEESEAYVTAVEVASTVAELKELVNEEYVAALTETGEYNSPVTSRDIKYLDSLMKYFDTTGIDSITLEAAGIKYYDLNGTNVTNPISGKVYIRVINGKSQKVLVK